MWQEIHAWLDHMLGLSLKVEQLTFAHMAGRTVIVFVIAIALSRVGDRRFLGRNAGYDMMLAITLGSVLSRGINGQAAFFPTLGASLLLVALHHLVSVITYHSHTWSRFTKGKPRVLVRAGTTQADELRRNRITVDDLEENLRLHGGMLDVSEVQEARLERNGEISVVKKKSASP
jgi:uncharacterized membrane protein YcaP (DUF421 family)